MTAECCGREHPRLHAPLSRGLFEKLITSRKGWTLQPRVSQYNEIEKGAESGLTKELLQSRSTVNLFFLLLY